MRGPWLPDATAAVFQRLARCPPIGRFVFVGGTALAWHLRHRLSEDLDLFMPALELDRRAITKVVDHLRDAFPVKRMPYGRAMEHGMLNDGVELDDVQQQYQVGAVKLEFFAGDDRRLIDSISTHSPVPSEFGHIRIATLDALFGMKAVALASRLLTRDLYDVVTLCGRPEFPPVALWERLEALGHSPDAVALSVARATKRTDDPGLTDLLHDPPEFEVLRQRAEEIFSAARRELARRGA
jgi:hypothetical protein